MKDRHRHCGYCGAAFASLDWPRRCDACGETTWRGVSAVAVLVVPVDDGVLVIRRGIRPVGKLALPGGYVDHGESWQVAAARELHEEAGVTLTPGQIDRIELIGLHTPPEGHVALAFGLAPPLAAADLPAWEPNEEVLERLIVRAPTELAFPLHTDILRDYFDRRGQ